MPHRCCTHHMMSCCVRYRPADLRGANRMFAEEMQSIVRGSVSTAYAARKIGTIHCKVFAWWPMADLRNCCSLIIMQRNVSIMRGRNLAVMHFHYCELWVVLIRVSFMRRLDHSILQALEHGNSYFINRVVAKKDRLLPGCPSPSCRKYLERRWSTPESGRGYFLRSRSRVYSIWKSYLRLPIWETFVVSYNALYRCSVNTQKTSKHHTAHNNNITVKKSH